MTGWILFIVFVAVVVLIIVLILPSKIKISSNSIKIGKILKIGGLIILNL